MSYISDQLLPKKLRFLPLLPILAYLLWLTNSHSLALQSLVFLLGAASIFVGLIVFRTPWNEVNRHYFYLLVGAGLLIIVGICWNSLFLIYIKTTGYEKDVFRKFLQNLRTPIYGVSSWSNWSWSRWLILFSSAFIVRVACWSDTWIEQRGLSVELLLWFAGFIFVIPLSDGPQRLIGTISHYRSFAMDVSRFDGVSHALQTYLQQMSHMSVHNSHYPPGNLLLTIIGSKYGIPWMAHGVVFLLTLLTTLPISGITKELHLSIYTKHIALSLFISCPSVLSLPSVAMTPIPMFLAAIVLWIMLVAIRKRSIFYSAAVGLVMAMLSFFSFTSIIAAGLLISVVFAQIISNRVKLIDCMRLGSVAISIFFLLYWLLYVFTGFNLYHCLVKAIEHNHSIMASGYDSILRYLFRSTGNLIAWMCSIGFMASVFGSLSGITALFRRRTRDYRPVATYSSAVLITVLLAAFSTLFFLETERIWLFFVPAWVIAAASNIGNASSKYKPFILKNVLIFSAFLVVGQEIVFQPYTLR